MPMRRHAARERNPVGFRYVGLAVLAPGRGIDVRAHPHIGLATVTYP